ncbi:c-type cytochrome biogenesis protein CcsB [Undibacterium sp. TJN25]|uniref:c-type cytochrome biogenesis protein CcsB n=1 Tax=Undibacterium sp. TJN25 TaxID=3413056 RepID=UPI003BF43647
MYSDALQIENEASLSEVFSSRPRLGDWLFLAALGISGFYALMRYADLMDAYELAILPVSVLLLGYLGLKWRPLQILAATAGAAGLLAIALYRGNLDNGGQVWLLKYLLASQASIMWMGLGFWSAGLLYGAGWLRRSDALLRGGSMAAWGAVAMGLSGMMVRWYESYLLGRDIGHIPVSNLYEVFVLFSLITALLYLHLEHRSGNRQLGALVMLVVGAAVAFLFWYGASAGVHEIQPLIPALKSYWMKMHVPANFIGYGSFSIAAMLGAAWLLAGKPFFSERLPSRIWLDELAYRAIALGFVFFTIATILGALWAAEAWGGYWSWDPKETWALIVWLNYAAWLHVRLVKNLRGGVLAWWSLAGFVVTLFAFLGVNMFLSGLHSYGSL